MSFSLPPPSLPPFPPHRYATITTTVMGSLADAKTVLISRDYTSARSSWIATAPAPGATISTRCSHWRHSKDFQQSSLALWNPSMPTNRPWSILTARTRCRRGPATSGTGEPAAPDGARLSPGHCKGKPTPLPTSIMAVTSARKRLTARVARGARAPCSAGTHRQLKM